MELTITHLAGLGDGVAQHEGRTVFVPYVCAGERVRVELTAPDRAELREVLTPSPERRAAPCEHFTQCGGCSLQQLSPEAYRAFKTQNLPQEVLAPLIEVGTQSRRRATLAVTVQKGEIQLGFHAARSHRVVDLHACPLLEAPIMAVIPSLRAALAQIKKPGLVQAVHLTALDAGLDVVVTTKAPLKEADRAVLSAWAAQQNIARLHENNRRLFGDAEQTVTFGSVPVAIPPEAFLQASSAGQEAITSAVLEHLSGCTSVVDLYSGCGTYSFPLAALLLSEQGEARSGGGSASDGGKTPFKIHVAAYEGSPEMVAAMHNAIARSGRESSLQATARDLYAQPLTAAELRFFDGAVINPPHNGALPQVKQLAASTVQKIAMVSCNPATFARDAKALQEGGYRLTRLLPIDQFTWSSHLELVGWFTRAGFRQFS